MVTIDDFAFNDYCSRCRKIMEHKIVVEDKQTYGVCSSCGEKRQLNDLNEVYYPKTELWVTRFKIGNTPSVVAGKLIDAIRRAR